MTKIISKEELLDNKEHYIEELRIGKIFIYPTDTLLGMGCNANLIDSIIKVKNIKKRDMNKPCSIIVPNFGWIDDACEIDKENFDFVKEKLPGPYTFVLKVKDKTNFSKEVNNNSDFIGVRIPKNWFIDIIRAAGVPVVTTSVNISGEKSALKIGDICSEIRENVDYIIDDIESTSGKPSTIIDLTGEQPEIIERDIKPED
jgi:L-threonylcarbamoyladenylate synthase